MEAYDPLHPYRRMSGCPTRSSHPVVDDTLWIRHIALIGEICQIVIGPVRSILLLTRPIAAGLYQPNSSRLGIKAVIRQHSDQQHHKERSHKKSTAHLTLSLWQSLSYRLNSTKETQNDQVLRFRYDMWPLR